MFLSVGLPLLPDLKPHLADGKVRRGRQGAGKEERKVCVGKGGERRRKRDRI